MKKDRRRKITLEMRDEIVRRRRAGEGAGVLAQEMNIARHTVDEIYQLSVYPKPKLSRRQLNYYLGQLGLATQNVVELFPRPPDKPKKSKKTTRKLDPTAWNQIRSRHQAGESVEVLAADFGVTKTSIHAGIKRLENPSPLIPMTTKHLQWLEKKLRPDARSPIKRWSPKEVRLMLKEKFGERISLRTFHSHLRWLGVSRPAKQTLQMKRFSLMRKEKARILREQERVVLEALANKQIAPLRRGRAKK